MLTKSIRLHQKLKGKIRVSSKVHLKTREILSLVYTPGVADGVKAIAANKAKVFDLTIKKNTVAVITDGSAVLGLGNVGPEAALPVMEGKCAIFSEFAGINAFPICLATQDVDEIVLTIKHISPVFGAINLEDISAPRCFEIEDKLQNIGIPVVHDDQHATAIVTLAGLINATKVVGKKLEDCKIVVVGAGAAGTALVKLLVYVISHPDVILASEERARPESKAVNDSGQARMTTLPTIIVVDRKGIVNRSRKDLPPYKKELVERTNKNNIGGDLKTAAKGADILIGVSTKGLFTKEIIQSMNKDPIVFALANPDPEVLPEDAKLWGVKVIATGRSDYPNQVNNALVFPGLFKALLKYRISQLTDTMKRTAAEAIASLVIKPSSDRIITSIFDRLLVPTILKSLSRFH